MKNGMQLHFFVTPAQKAEINLMTVNSQYWHKTCHCHMFGMQEINTVNVYIVILPEGFQLHAMKCI
jgi:hypothetical protein